MRVNHENILFSNISPHGIGILQGYLNSDPTEKEGIRGTVQKGTDNMYILYGDSDYFTINLNNISISGGKNIFTQREPDQDATELSEVLLIEKTTPSS